MGEGGGAYSKRGQQPLGHVGHDDANEKDDSVDPVVAKNESNNKEGSAEEDGHGGDDVDEVLYLACYWRLSRFDRGGQVRDPSHHRVVPRVHHDAPRPPYNRPIYVEIDVESYEKIYM